MCVSSQYTVHNFHTLALKTTKPYGHNNSEGCFPLSWSLETPPSSIMVLFSCTSGSPSLISYLPGWLLLYIYIYRSKQPFSFCSVRTLKHFSTLFKCCPCYITRPPKSPISNAMIAKWQPAKTWFCSSFFLLSFLQPAWVRTLMPEVITMKPARITLEFFWGTVPAILILAKLTCSEVFLGTLKYRFPTGRHFVMRWWININHTHSNQCSIPQNFNV